MMLLCAHLGSVAIGSAYTADSYFEYVKSVYDQHEKKLSGFLVAELQTFVRMFPQDDHAAEASYLLAQVYLERGKDTGRWRRSSRRCTSIPPPMCTLRLSRRPNGS